LSGINVSVRGSFNRTQAFLQRMKNHEQFKGLEKYGAAGVAALSAATPKETSKTANSWSYEIVNRPGYFAIHWHNSNVDSQGTPIAVLIQYGHATGTGGYVQGVDYINPALRPIFDQILADMQKEVNK